MITTTYKVATPNGGFEAQWDEDDEIPVQYVGDADAIAAFKAFLDLGAVSGREGALIQFDSLEPADLYGFCQSEKYGITVLPTVDDLLDEQQQEQEPEMQAIYDSASDAETFALIGEGAQLLNGLDENSDTFFADLGTLREIIQKLGVDAPVIEPTPDLTPSALTLNVDSIQAVLAESVPANLPAAWIIMNAPRPLLGQETAQGDFLHGRFYAAIDPQDEYSQGYIDRNVKDDGYVVFVADKATQMAMALQTVDTEYLPAYLEMDEQERGETMGSHLADLNKGKTFGELKALAAKGMPTVALPEPVPAIVVDPTPEPAPASASTEPVNMEIYIKAAADSIAELRRVDVYRVLSGLAADNIDNVTRPMLASWIIANRPDLEKEVTDVMNEEWPGEMSTGAVDPVVPVVVVDPVAAVAEPLPDGGAVVPPAAGETTTTDPQRAADLAYLADVTAGTVTDMWADEVPDRIEAIIGKYAGDADMEAAAREAVAAYTDFMTKAITAE